MVRHATHTMCYMKHLPRNYYSDIWFEGLPDFEKEEVDPAPAKLLPTPVCILCFHSLPRDPMSNVILFIPRTNAPCFWEPPHVIHSFFLFTLDELWKHPLTKSTTTQLFAYRLRIGYVSASYVVVVRSAFKKTD